MITALGMYDRPELRDAHDAYWALIRDNLQQAGIAAPETLNRDEYAYWPGWESPDLLLSQTCGMPFRTRLKDRVTLIGTPDFGLEGCPPGYYCSMLIARHNDPRTALADFASSRFAYNEDLSQSGWAAASNHMTALGLGIRPILQTGGHAMSAQAVAEGKADWAAIDAQTWRLLSRFEPGLVASLRVIGRTPPTPGLPYITAKDRDPASIRAAIHAAISALPIQTREALGLQGLILIAPDVYYTVPVPPAPAPRAV